jgi:uncharacterized protein (TIGR00661 family)
MEIPAAKRILITPLDWGLGHATRCIPIIDEFLRRGIDIQIATSGDALILLRKEYPLLTFHEIVSYKAHYAELLPLSVSLLFQVPKFLNSIRKEHAQIEKIVRENRIDILISDNRYGCWTRQVPCVLITHQLTILLPRLIQWKQPILNFFNRRMIRRFDRCWVPDNPHDPLTGKLGRAEALQVTYVGRLSRFQKSVRQKKYDVLVLLSGPEPQRTILEREMVKRLSKTSFKAMLVRGLPGGSNPAQGLTDHVEQRDYLNARELNDVIVESEIVVARSGYSTIMDLARLNKKAIFIPTPGQTEQEYLARQLMKQNVAFCTTLGKLDLAEAIKASFSYTGFENDDSEFFLKQAINDLLK